jgi:hypothetical protein
MDKVDEYRLCQCGNLTEMVVHSCDNPRGYDGGIFARRSPITQPMKGREIP